MNQDDDNAIDPKIKSAFNGVMDFKFPIPTARDIQGTIQAEVEFEALSAKHLLLNEHCMTNGMRTSCLDPASTALADFHERVDRFEMSIAQYLPEMKALLTLEEDIDFLEKQSTMSEHLAEKAVASDERFGEAKKSYESHKKLYEKMYMEKNSIHAKDFPAWIYIPLLLGIGVVEWAINYSAVLEQYGTPILAMGITAILGFSVAYASHEHGTLLKQREYFFGPTVSPEKKRGELLRVCGAAFALLLTLAFVGWSRYVWMAAEVARYSQVTIIGNGGTPSPGVNLVQQVLITMAANLLVYLIGVAIAFWVHDADPDYTTRLQDKKKAQKIWNGWQAKVTAKIQVIRAQLKNAIQDKQNLARGLQERFKPLTDMQRQVDEKKNRILGQADDFVKGLVNTYRAQLVAIARVENIGLQFNNKGNLIGLDEYGHIRVACPEMGLCSHQNQESANV